MTERRDFSRDLSLAASLAILIVATLLVYFPVVTFEFTNWDDYETVARNPRMNPVATRSFVYFWTRPHMELYVPLTYTVWGVTATTAQLPPPPPEAPTPRSLLRPGPFHALNLVLHLAAACAALLLVRELVDSNVAAMAGALLFALHPLQVEAVAWVSGTKDVLFALLSLVALWQYVRCVKTRDASPHKSRRSFAAATVLFVLAMLAKPTAVVVPPLALAIDVLLLRGRRHWRDALATLWPWFVLMIPCIVWTSMVQSARQAASAAPPIWLRPVVALDAIAFYIAKLLAPARLAVDYGRNPAAIIASGAIRWTWIMPIGLGVLLVFLARMGERLLLAGACVALIGLSPVLGLVPFSFQAYSTVADHYFYLPMIGPALVVAWLIQKASARAIILSILALAGVGLAMLSHRQVMHWRDTDTLFANALRVNPTSFAATSNVAANALDHGDFEQAIELSRRAMKLNPADVAPHMVFADAMRNIGDFQAAQGAYRQALLRDPDHGPALNNLAAMLASTGQLEHALPFAERAARLQPDLIEPQLNLGKMYFQLGQAEPARRQFQRVLQLDPQNAESRQLLSALP